MIYVRSFEKTDVNILKNYIKTGMGGKSLEKYAFNHIS